MPDTPASLAGKLKSEGEKLFAYFDDLTDAQWQTTIYTEGAEWTVRSILAHLFMAEKGFVKLFEGIRQGGPGAPEDFDIDRYNAGQQVKTHELSPAELLAQFRAIRVEMTHWVASIEETDLARRGYHPFLGHTTLLEMIKLIYLHNNLHLRDIKKALA